MKKHTQIYLDYFGYGEQDFIPCEFCGKSACDIHHIDARGMGGNPNANKDIIENLMAVCRRHHDRCEDGTIPKEEQISTHLHFMSTGNTTFASCDGSSVERASRHQREGQRLDTSPSLDT